MGMTMTQKILAAAAGLEAVARARLLRHDAAAGNGRRRLRHARAPERRNHNAPAGGRSRACRYARQ